FRALSKYPKLYFIPIKLLRLSLVILLKKTFLHDLHPPLR
ncbi:MAG: hypothetical protein ACI9GZ_001999, partial [Bacteroidia bacterium]